MKKQDQLLDLNVFGTDQPLDFSNEAIHKAIKNPAVLTVEGSAQFQDFERLNTMASKINDLGRFLTRATIEKFKETPAYLELQQQIELQKQIVRNEKDRNARSRANSEIRNIEKALEQQLDYKRETVPEWIIEGIKSFIGTLMPNRLQLRVFPFQKNPQFCVIANLKRDCFLDADFDNILFAYGPRPNVLLTMFGLITSVPRKDAHLFDFTEVLAGLPDEQRQMEEGFQQTFNALEELERLVRFSYYPNITIYPIAVYQRLGTLIPDEEGDEIPDDPGKNEPQ